MNQKGKQMTVTRELVIRVSLCLFLFLHLFHIELRTLFRMPPLGTLAYLPRATKIEEMITSYHSC